MNYRLLTIIVLISLTIAGCSGSPPPAASPDEHEHNLLITGMAAGEHRISISTIRSMPAVTGEAVTIDSAGEQSVVPFAGVELDSILQEINVERADLFGLRFIASDGYAAELPTEMIQSRQIILAWSVHNRELQGSELPLRSVIPDERSMYWVKGVCEIELVFDKPPEGLSQLTILDNMLSSLLTATAEVDGESVPAVATATIPGLQDQQRVTIVGADGLTKREALHSYPFYLALCDAGLVLTAPELPLGMRVKNVAAIITDEQVFIYLAALGSDVSGQQVLKLIEDFLASPQVTIDLGEAGQRELDLTVTSFTKSNDLFMPNM